MLNLENKKLDLKKFLEELGFTVSLDYEREPTGTLFAIDFTNLMELIERNEYKI